MSGLRLRAGLRRSGIERGAYGEKQIFVIANKRQASFIRLGITVLWMVSGCAGPLRESLPSLPEQLRIVEPNADVPAGIAAFSGIWSGKWSTRDGEVRPHVLVVENITATHANLIFSPGLSGSWFRITGRVIQGELVLEWVNSRGEQLIATYQMKADQHSILATFRFGVCADTTEFHPRCHRAQLVKVEQDDPRVASARTSTPEQSLRARGLVPLSQQQLEERHARRVKARYDNHVGARGTIDFTPDGSVRVNGTLEATGTWLVKDGRLCTSYKQLRQGAEACFTLYRTGEKEFAYFQSDSPVRGLFTDLD